MNALKALSGDGIGGLSGLASGAMDLGAMAGDATVRLAAVAPSSMIPTHAYLVCILAVRVLASLYCRAGCSAGA